MTAAAAGLSFVFKEIRYHLYLQCVEIRGSIKDLCACVTIKQTYLNHYSFENGASNPALSSSPDCHFTFPLDEGSAVCEFSASYEDQLVEGRLKAKDTASKEYHAAIRSGKPAMLLEEKERNIFNCRVGNIKPGGLCVISITYLTTLTQEGRYIRMNLPMKIAPKYSPSGNKWKPIVATERNHQFTEREIFHLPPTVSAVRGGDSVDLSDFKPIGNDWYAEQSPQSLSIILSIQTASPLISISCPSHPEMDNISNRASNSPYHSTVSLHSTPTNHFAYLSSDVVILVDQLDAYSPRAICEIDPVSNTAAISLAVIPSSIDMKAAATLQCEFIFILDQSGSMSGVSIGAVRQLMQIIIRSLPTRSRFNIYGFGSTYAKLFQCSEEYNDNSLAKASRFIESLDANLGGTEIYAPLADAMNKATALPTHPRQIFLLTDGEVSNTQELIDLTSLHVGSSRLFTFGIGLNVDRHLIKQLAKAGNGEAEFILPSGRPQNLDLREKGMRQLHRAVQPSYTDVQVDWKDFAAPNSHFAQCPRHPAAIFPDSRTVIYALQATPVPGFVEELAAGRLLRFEREIKILAMSNRPEEKQAIHYNDDSTGISPSIILSVKITHDNVTSGNIIHRLAAKQRIQELENLVPHNFNHQEEILSLSLRYGIVSKQSSFIIQHQNGKEEIAEIRANQFNSTSPQVLSPNSRGPDSSAWNDRQYYSSPAFMAAYSSDAVDSYIDPISFLSNGIFHGLDSSAKYRNCNINTEIENGYGNTRGAKMPTEATNIIRDTSESSSRPSEDDNYCFEQSLKELKAEPALDRSPPIGAYFAYGAKNNKRYEEVEEEDQEEENKFHVRSQNGTNVLTTTAPVSSSSDWFEELFHSLIQLQTANGSWSLTEDFISLLKAHILPSVDLIGLEKLSSKLNVQSNVIATMIAVRVLQLHYFATQSIWAFIHTKANLFLNLMIKTEAEMARIEKEINALTITKTDTLRD